MKKIFSFLSFLLLISCAYAQKPIVYEIMFYNNVLKETNDYTLRMENIISNDKETKFKLKITNKTSDYLILKTAECKFKINGKEYSIKEKPVIIEPNESNSKVINLLNTGMNATKNYEFVLNGMTKVPTDGKPITAPSFKLPPSQNDFKASGFNVVLGKWTKETQGTDAKFSVTYNGDNVGFVFPGRVSMELPNGEEYASNTKKPKTLMLMKGEDGTFDVFWDRMQGGKSTDMQKLTMMLKWTNVFMESTPVKLESHTMNVEFDEATSNAKK